jgi:multiple sugar transport system substrate-binding protein
VVFWFVGQRMREFTAPGLLEDVSDLFTSDVKADLHRSALDLVSVAGRQYGVPYGYYQVGLYFRRDVLERAGAIAPRTWDELLATCARLKSASLEPFAIGSKDLWPTAAWFDYIDLRLNGYAFHMALMGGQVPYTDARVRRVFDKWSELLRRNCFTKNHASMSWQESQALLYQGKSAMMLIGNYIVPNFPPTLRDRMDFVPFPVIDPQAGSAEEAPMNSIHIPVRAANKRDARRFLAFVLRAEVQEALNRTLLQIPVNRRSAIPDDRFLKLGAKLLMQADDLSQFFDRDTSEDLATIAMKGFQEFMLNPERLDAILATIERARVRIYKQ